MADPLPDWLRARCLQCRSLRLAHFPLENTYRCRDCRLKTTGELIWEDRKGSARARGLVVTELPPPEVPRGVIIDLAVDLHPDDELALPHLLEFVGVVARSEALTFVLQEGVMVHSPEFPIRRTPELDDDDLFTLSSSEGLWIKPTGCEERVIWVKT